jgi:hypothetical protein
MSVFSFRFDTLRVSLGAVVISVGTGLFAFAPRVEIIAALIFFLGVLLTAGGLVALTPRGVVIHSRWSLPRILRALSRAPTTATVEILQTWFPEEDFVDRLQHFYRYEGKRFHLRIMLMNPDPLGVNDVLTARVKLRWIERAKAASDITQALDGLLRLKREVDIVLHDLARTDGRYETVDIEVRLYDYLPFGPIYKVGEDVLFVGFYLNHTSSVFGPMIEVRKQRSPDLWRVFEQNLRTGWDASTPYYPQVTAKDGSNGP